VERKGVSKVFDFFNQDKKSGHFSTLADSNLSHLEGHHLALGGYPTLHQ
jgi:hypothetical protein